MNLTLQLAPDTESKLKAQAALTGKTVEVLALEALQEKLSDQEVIEATRTPSSRLTEFRAWFAAHPSSEASQVDDSRESFYGHRGA